MDQKTCKKERPPLAAISYKADNADDIVYGARLIEESGDIQDLPTNAVIHHIVWWREPTDEERTQIRPRASATTVCVNQYGFWTWGSDNVKGRFEDFFNKTSPSDANAAVESTQA